MKISSYCPFNSIKYNYSNRALKFKMGNATEALALSICKSAKITILKGLKLSCFGFSVLWVPGDGP
jgi:hypothetical protein